MPNVGKRSSLYLWEFLLELLDGKEPCPAISWLDRDSGVFVLKDQSEIAKLWGKLKGRPLMDKIKLGRAIRYYYKTGLLTKVPRKRAAYRFIKIDYLQHARRSSQTLKHIPENDLTVENKNINSKRLSSFQDGEEDGDEDEHEHEDEVEDIEHMPLENILAHKRDIVFRNEKCQTLLRMRTKNLQNEFRTICNRSTDNIRNLGTDTFGTYENDGSNDLKTKELETHNYSNNTTANDVINNDEYASFYGNNPLASLRMKIIVIGDDL